jgi:hypothetical protein
LIARPNLTRWVLSPQRGRCIQSLQRPALPRR